jgi:hypothetical protein
MALLSRYNIETPISKVNFLALVNYLDNNLETFEASAVAGLPAGDGKNWLLANASIARRLVVMIADRRREVL